MSDQWWRGDKATPEELRANAWQRVRELRDLFHYRAELLFDDDLEGVSLALSALLLDDDARTEVVEAARHALRGRGQRHLLGECADAVVDEILVAINAYSHRGSGPLEEKPLPVERVGLALSVTRAILHRVTTSRVLQLRAPECATFADSVEAHEENVQRVKPLIEKRLEKWTDDTDREKAARRLVIATMTELGDTKAESSLFTHHRNERKTGNKRQ